MCGIAGIFNLNNEAVNRDTLKRFTDSMTHRGPDGAGYELLNNDTLGLGHRRLAILDLSEAGKQPMNILNNRYTITYNGEVYNFNEIKSELKAKGYHFISETDTEVILYSFAEWGDKCLDKFNGEWAIAIWDNEKKELFLARDRFGIKPLYYIYEPNKRFVFASETRAFKFLDGFERLFNDDLLQHNIQNPYALEGIGLTVFQGIQQLLPGHKASLGNYMAFKQVRWWDIHNHNKQNIPKSNTERIEMFYALFRDSCKIRLVSDVPIATALSGGLDSTAVYSTVFDILNNEKLNRVNSNSQQAFSAIFTGLPNDEKQYVDKAINYTKGNVNYIELDQYSLSKRIEKDTELLDIINSLPGTSVSEIYAAMRRKGIFVSLDGHGVDEMLYGYTDMIQNLFNFYLQTSQSKKANEVLKVLEKMYYPDYYFNIKDELQNRANNYNSLQYKSKVVLKKILGKSIFDDTEYIRNNKLNPIGEPYNFLKKSYPEKILYYEFFEHCLPAILRNFDRTSMSNGVEIRMPFMDWRLVSYVFSLPMENKLGNEFTKLILRESMKGKMDESLRTRTYKVGITSPVTHWFNHYLKDWVLEITKDNKILNSQLEMAYKDGNLNDMQTRKAWQYINLKLIK